MSVSGSQTPVLRAHDLSVELGGLPVLRGINLDVRAGEAVALLGGNGSGKSTLVRTLLGLVPLQRGSVELFGQPLGHFRHWSKVGYVPQHSTASLSGAKVKEVVASGRLSRRAPFVPPRAADRVAVAGALDAVGLADRASDRLSVLSGGQQQRALIARALAGEPDLLVLDEPTAGMDPEAKRSTRALIAGLRAEGRAILLTTHDLADVERLADRVVILARGRIVAEGAPATLIASPSPP